MNQRALLKVCIGLLLVATLVVLPETVFSTQSRLIYGAVISATTGRPISGALVTVSKCGLSQSTSTESDGSWRLTFPYGEYGTIDFSAPGYKTQTYEITYNANWAYAGGTISLMPL
jgi:hypothetical protein